MHKIGAVAVGDVLTPPPLVPLTESAPPSPEEDTATQNVKASSQSEANFSDVSKASDKPHHVDVESTGMHSSVRRICRTRSLET